MSEEYRSSGNVLLDDLFGATRHSFPAGGDEEGADAKLREIADALRRKGRHPYVIPLSPSNPPLGASGYLVCAAELLSQSATPFDSVVVASGSGLTHAGLLFGLRLSGWRGDVIGICTRRSATEQTARLHGHCAVIATLLGIGNPVMVGDIKVHDDMVAPSYGQLNSASATAIDLAARLEGLLLDPVYTARAFAGLIARVLDGTILSGSRVVFIHTGGLPALFAYHRELRNQVIDRRRSTPGPSSL